MPKERKTVDLYDIQGYYAGRWESVAWEWHRVWSLTTIKEYRENETGTKFRVVRKRLRKAELTAEQLDEVARDIESGEEHLRQQRTARAAAAREKCLFREQADTFIDRIIAEPYSSDARLIFSDWLEDQGRLTEAYVWRRNITRIDSIPQEFARLLPNVYEHWSKLALSTQPCDHAAAWAAVLRIYQQLGLAAPKWALWVPSPLCGEVVARVLLRTKDPAAPRFTEWLERLVNRYIEPNASSWFLDRRRVVYTKDIGQFFDAGYSPYSSKMSTPAFRAYTRLLKPEQFASTFGVFFNDISAHTYSAVWETLRAHRSISNITMEKHRYCALLDYAAHSLLGSTVFARFDPFLELAHHCHCWWPLDEVVIFSERPVQITKTENAPGNVVYRDNFSMVQELNSLSHSPSFVYEDWVDHLTRVNHA